MSIEPEVPYRIEEESDGSDDLDDTWRDPNLGQPAARQQSFVTNHSTAPVSARSSPYSDIYKETSRAPEVNHSASNDHWILPAYITLIGLLGPQHKQRIAEIQNATGSYIEYNESLNQIDIWGDETAVNKAKSHLEFIASTRVENDPSPTRKSKKWSRPERELTERERRRAEKKQARVDEEKRYQGLPPNVPNYNSLFPLPDNSVPINRLLGENESYFNQIRAECKAYIWYEATRNVIKLAAETEESITSASKRVRNWYLRCCRKPVCGVLYLMQQPGRQYKLNFRKLPSNFVTFEYADPEREKIMLDKHRLLEPVNVGDGQTISIGGLISFTDPDGSNNTQRSQTELPEPVATLNQRNEERIEKILQDGLESMRLNDWNIRMKIRFGQICLTDYLKKDTFLNIEDVSDKMFLKSKFKSALATCIAKSQGEISGLFEFLTMSDDIIKFSDNPRTTFAIEAEQFPTASPARVLGRKDPPRGDKWETKMQVLFNDEGRCRLSNTMTDCTDLVEVSMSDMESHYSWDLKLQYARRLPADDIDSPHEKFAHLLRLSAENRLILATSDDYSPQIVTQKTKWKYSWDEYIIEICKDEVWDMNRVERKDRALPVDLTNVDPHRVLYKVSIYKEAWVNRFSENLNLKIGEAPSWSLRDFLASPNENARSIMETAKKFSDILNSKVPLYWDNVEASLI